MHARARTCVCTSVCVSVYVCRVSLRGYLCVCMCAYVCVCVCFCVSVAVGIGVLLCVCMCVLTSGFSDCSQQVILVCRLPPGYEFTHLQSVSSVMTNPLCCNFFHLPLALPLESHYCSHPRCSWPLGFDVSKISHCFQCQTLSNWAILHQFWRKQNLKTTFAMLSVNFFISIAHRHYAK